MSHVFPVYNVFREDVVTNGDGSEQPFLMRLPERQCIQGAKDDRLAYSNVLD